MDPLQVAAIDGQIAWDRGPHGQDERVVALEELLRAVGVRSDLHSRVEAGPLRPHLGQPPVHDSLLELESGDPVAQEAAGLVRLLVHGDRVPGARQLLGGCEPGRAGADDRDRAARQELRDPRLYQPGVPGRLDDRVFDLLDGHGLLVDAQDAARFAGRRAEPSREVGEVVGRVEAFDRLGQPVATREVVPFGDEVAEGAGEVAEGHAAVHAPGGLALQERGAVRAAVADLLPVADAHLHGPLDGQLPAAVGQKAPRISHGLPPTLDSRLQGS